MSLHPQAIFAKARKLPKQSPELKADLEAFEARLDADAAEVAEEEAASAAAAAAQAEAAGPRAPGVDGAAAAAGGEDGGNEDAAMEGADDGQAAEGHLAREEGGSRGPGSLIQPCICASSRSYPMYATKDHAQAMTLCA